MKRKFPKIKVNYIENFPVTIIDGGWKYFVDVRKRKKHLH